MEKRISLLLMGVSLLLFVSLIAAEPPLFLMLNDLCSNVRKILPLVAILMIILAGIVYAAGQVLGSETRSRINVWATAMLLGGILCLIIGVSAHHILRFIYAAAGMDAPDNICAD